MTPIYSRPAIALSSREYPIQSRFCDGVVGLTRSAALEHAEKGPRICAICPGWIDTPPVANWMKRNAKVATEIVRQMPRGRIGDADEIAAAVL
jgi:NAD(P)-dependent dehydrogenase (short-subunit alcohol dehydrogenase family)